jgi:hypothetical protein
MEHIPLRARHPLSHAIELKQWSDVLAVKLVASAGTIVSQMRMLATLAKHAVVRGQVVR